MHYLIFMVSFEGVGGLENEGVERRENQRNRGHGYNLRRGRYINYNYNRRAQK